jgi:enoyl-CoA hydratase
LIGKSKATELLLTAGMIDANTALDYGLVNYVLEANEAKAKCEEIIGKTAKKGPLAIEETLRCIRAHFDEKMDGYLYEAQAFGRVMGSAESKEGVQAFLEKRKPNF